MLNPTSPLPLKDPTLFRQANCIGGKWVQADSGRTLVVKNPATGEEILRLLDDLHREYNNTILLVTHNDLAAAFCDRVLTLRDGQFVKEVHTGRTGSSPAGDR